LICESIPGYGGAPLAISELRKCEACGFPVSGGRKLCVDCEEKNWRGKDWRGKDSRGKVRAGVSSAGRTVAGQPIQPAQPSSAAVPAENLRNEDAPAEEVTILTAAMEPAPSWLAANKYVLGAIVAAAVAIGVVLFLR
jgi:hypothetical protein